MPTAAYPDVLWLVRHGESEGNVAHRRAEQSGALTVDCESGDMDMPLTALGVEQSRALGRRFGCLAPAERPDAVVVSPYLRAQQTARHLLATAGLEDLATVTDERVRDRDEGLMHRLTDRGFRERHPEEAARADGLGAFFYRPPGGEAWTDVALRVRDALRDLREQPPGRRVLVVSHDLTIIAMRYVIEHLTAAQATGLSGRIGNCSVTTYDGNGTDLFLHGVSDTAMPAADAAE